MWSATLKKILRHMKATGSCTTIEIFSQHLGDAPAPCGKRIIARTLGYRECLTAGPSRDNATVTVLKRLIEVQYPLLRLEVRESHPLTGVKAFSEAVLEDSRPTSSFRALRALDLSFITDFSSLSVFKGFGRALSASSLLEDLRLSIETVYAPFRGVWFDLVAAAVFVPNLRKADLDIAPMDSERLIALLKKHRGTLETAIAYKRNFRRQEMITEGEQSRIVATIGSKKLAAQIMD